MIQAIVFDLYGTLTDGRELYPEAQNVLGQLKDKGYKLGLISNASSISGKRLYALGIDLYFDSVVWAYETARPKPYPEPFKKMLEQLHVSPEEVMYIGDSEDIDAKGAEAVGMFAVQIKRDGGEAGFHRKVKSLEELFQFLDT